MSVRTLRPVAWVVLFALVGIFYIVGLTSGDGVPRTDGERAYAIKETTLCPVCDGQNVLESNAAIATSIRALIDESVSAGLTDSQVRGLLADEFGDDVNAIPPRSGWGALVWIVPVVAAILGAGGLVLSIRRWRTMSLGRADAEDVRLVASARRRRQ